MEKNNNNYPMILVYYFDCSSIPRNDVVQFIDKIIEQFDIKSSDILQYFIPIFNQDTRIECINPQIVSGDEYSEIKKRLDEMEPIFKDFVKGLKDKIM